MREIKLLRGDVGLIRGDAIIGQGSGALCVCGAV